MILLSNGGTNMQARRAASDLIAIGTVDGVVIDDIVVSNSATERLARVAARR